jgi:hypothetical protein
VAGEQERGGQDEDAGDRDRGAGAGQAGQQAPQGGQGRDRLDRRVADRLEEILTDITR